MSVAQTSDPNERETSALGAGLLAQVTPVILTFNEAPNIGRSLERLTWARTVIVVDSHSTDSTIATCARFPNVRVVQRCFDSHVNQWNFGLSEVPESSPWVLALDADHIVTGDFLSEISALTPTADISGYWCSYRYSIFGRDLRSSLYPPAVALFRRSCGHYVQQGHTQRAVVQGELGSIVAPILHDDRKPFDRWINSQRGYARLEAENLIARAAARELDFKGWLRACTPLAPLAVAFHCLILRGGILDGRAGWYYALQRMAAEALITATVLDSRLRGRTSAPTAVAAPESKPSAPLFSRRARRS